MQKLVVAKRLLYKHHLKTYCSLFTFLVPVDVFVSKGP